LEGTIRGVASILARIGEAHRDPLGHRVVERGLRHKGIAVDRYARNGEVRERADESLVHLWDHIAEGMPPTKQARPSEARQARELVLGAQPQGRGAEIIAAC